MWKLICKQADILFVEGMIITTFNHAAYKFYGWIILLPIVFAFGFYHYFTEGIFSY